MLSKISSKDTQAEQDDVSVSNSFSMGGYAGERSYAADSFSMLGVKPNSVKAGIIGGQPSGLVAMLPGDDPSRYEAIFRAIFSRGIVYCSSSGCKWKSRSDTWNASKGTLTGASTSQTIFSDTETAFTCQYR
jgi:hypothetical protein